VTTTTTVSEKGNRKALARTRTIIFWHNDIWRREQEYCHKKCLISLLFNKYNNVLIKFFYSPTDAQVNCLKAILKFT
jgi:hypothetical protein